MWFPRQAVMQEYNRNKKFRKVWKRKYGFSETLDYILVNFLGNIDSCSTYILSPTEQVHSSGRVYTFIIYKAKHHCIKSLMEKL